MPDGYLAILSFKNYYLKLFAMEGFKQNQKQGELYDQLHTHHSSYINYQLLANFVLPIALYSSLHYFEAVLTNHVILSLNDSVFISKI